MRKIIVVLSLLVYCFGFSQQKSLDQKVNALLKLMTLEEKIGQLNQCTGDNQATGPITINPKLQVDIKFNVSDFNLLIKFKFVSCAPITPTSSSPNLE